MADEIEKRIRRLRKKLIQISNLEILSRELNLEETIKVGKKVALRTELLSLLQELDSDMKRKQNSDLAPQLKTSSSKAQKSSNSSSTRSSRSAAPTQDLEETSEEVTVTEDLNTETVDRVGSETADVPTTSSSVVTSSTDPREAARSVPGTSSTESGSVNRTSEKIKLWRSRCWIVDELEGHEDRIVDCDVDLDNNLLVTASCDTTLKVWDLNTGDLCHSLRGHTGAVSGATFLKWNTPTHRGADCEDELPPHSNHQHFVQQINQDQVVVVSASIDCSLKVWRLDTCVAASIYTYNGISKLKVIQKYQYSITGTEGGKLEMYDLYNGKLVTSHPSHEEAVTALSLHESEDKIMLASGSADGSVNIFQVLEDKLRCLYVSENVCSITTDTSIHIRPVSSIYITDSEIVYYGDTGHNLKLLDWQHNRVHKFANHTSDQGFTDAISGSNQVMIASGFDVDTGCGQINMYMPRQHQLPIYLTTLADNTTERICCVCMRESSSGDVTVVSAGYDIKVWKYKNNSNTTSNQHPVIKGCVLSLGDTELIDSGTEDSDIEAPDTTTPHLGDAQLPVKPAAGFCNCVVS